VVDTSIRPATSSFHWRRSISFDVTSETTPISATEQGETRLDKETESVAQEDVQCDTNAKEPWKEYIQRVKKDTRKKINYGLFTLKTMSLGS